MSNLVSIFKGEPSVSHLVIAENTHIKTRSVRLLIDKHLDDFKEFGEVSFEMTKPQNNEFGEVSFEMTSDKMGVCDEKSSFSDYQKRKIYYLNEQQSMLILTYLQNTPIVREFKKALIKEFYLIRENFSIGLKQYNKLKDYTDKLENKLSSRPHLDELIESVGELNSKLVDLEDKNRVLAGKVLEVTDKYIKAIERENSSLRKAELPLNSKKSTRLSPDEKNEIIKLYKAGNSKAEISRWVKRSDTAISSVLKSKFLF